MQYERLWDEQGTDKEQVTESCSCFLRLSNFSGPAFNNRPDYGFLCFLYLLTRYQGILGGNFYSPTDLLGLLYADGDFPFPSLS